MRLGFLLLLVMNISVLFAQQEKRIWFNQPAAFFEEAFPLGNGRIGAMVYGSPVTDKISLNEITLWGGYPKNPHMNPEAASHIPKIREALFTENYKLADSLIRFVQGTFLPPMPPLATCSCNSMCNHLQTMFGNWILKMALPK